MPFAVNGFKNYSTLEPRAQEIKPLFTLFLMGNVPPIKLKGQPIRRKEIIYPYI